MSCYSYFFFFKQKTAYEMRISDWSSDVCSSDLRQHLDPLGGLPMLLGEFLDRLLLQGEELLPVVEIRGLGLGEEVAGERAGIPRQREDCGGNRRFPVEQHAADVLSVDVGAVQDHPEDRVLLLGAAEGQGLGD